MSKSRVSKSKAKRKVAPGLIISALILFVGIGVYLTASAFAGVVYPITFKTPAALNYQYDKSRSETFNTNVKSARYTSAGALIVTRNQTSYDIGPLTLYPKIGTPTTGGKFQVCLRGKVYTRGGQVAITLNTQIGTGAFTTNNDQAKEVITRVYRSEFVGRYTPVHLCTTANYYAGNALYPRFKVDHYPSNQRELYNSVFELEYVTFQRVI